MKKLYKLLLPLLIVFASMPVFASTFSVEAPKHLVKAKDMLVYDGNIYLSTQAEIDQFQTSYPGVTEITGELRIYNSADVMSLSGLNTITSVGTLSIYGNAVLSDLSGLNNLTTINYDCYIGATAQTTMSGLNAVVSIGGYLAIESTENLVSFNGFNNLQSVSSVYIDYNSSLTTLPQFLSLTSASTLYIYQNPALSVCNQTGICNILPTVSHSISNNASGCNNVQQLQMACGLPVTCGDVYLYSQADVDNFPTNYGCSIVTGQLYISGTDIINLNALSGITQLGSLQLYNLPMLNNYAGLNNVNTITGNLEVGGDMATTVTALSGVTSIGGTVSIQSYGMQSFIGLNNVATIGGNLNIYYNDALTALPGMINLNSCGNLNISNNNALISLSGLNNLATLNGSLELYYNNALTSISALSNLTQINGSIDVYSNSSLASLTGLNNISIGGITNLYIRYNPLLSVCNQPNFCAYVAGGGSTSVYSNAPGCNSYNQIQVTCGTPQNCSYISLYSQQDVDSYAFNYGCTEVGSIYISGSNIQNLDALSMITAAESIQFSYVSGLSDVSGLSNITSLSGSLQIYGDTQPTFPALTSLVSIGSLSIENTPLTHLPSLPGITTIGGSVSVYNNQQLVDLDGFANLTSIGESLNISYNDVLADLTDLTSLTSVNGSLNIYDNDIITSLSGLDNVAPASISYLGIGNNPQLSFCTLTNICTYLNSGGDYSIYSNAVGCSEFSELSAICNVGCPTEDVNLTSQAEVDAFAVSYPSCTLIPGSLTISGDDITDLSALSNIASINGDLTIYYNQSLTSLNGLNAVNAVHGQLTIYQNPVLADLDGLGALTTIDSNLSIENNAALANLNGLSSLDSVGYSLSIYYNDALTSISGLSGITSVNGSVNITGNTSLSSLSGMNMTSISGSVEISYNNSLSSINGFSNLTSAYSLNINGNPLLTSVAGFTSLATLNELEIRSNEAMTSLGWNAPVTQVQYVKISYNTALTNLLSLSSITNSNSVNIENNAALTSLSGLGVTALEYLNISGNDSLMTLSALSSLTNVDNLYVNSNAVLTSMSGLENLNGSEWAYVTINSNPLLTSLVGFGPTELYHLTISNNAQLSSLSALSGLTKVDYLYLSENNALTSLSGLENLNATDLNYVSILSSTNLSLCNIAPICTFLGNGGSSNISGNAAGCAGSLDIQLACGPTTQCPTGEIIFTSQSQIDQFIVAYPTCTSLPSYVTISGADITNLNGLANITYVANPLVIENNPLLTDLTGLNNLTFVGALTISNNASLTSLSALSNLDDNCYNVQISNNDALTSLNGIQNLPIAGTININGNDALTDLVTFNNLNGVDYLYINNNDALTSLASLGGFSTLYSMQISGNDLLADVSVSGISNCYYIYLDSNAMLANLSGLNTLNWGSLYGLSIYNHPALSICNTAAICNYLDNGGNAYFSGNAEGCANNSEVQIACGNGEPPTFGSVAPTAVTVCDNQQANLTISGLVADSISQLIYTFDGASMLTATLYANTSGNASFNPTLYLANNAQTLTLVSIERIDVATGTLTLSTDNTVALSVSEPITYYRDYDGDTYGNLWDTSISCTGIPTGYVTNSTDCYDYDATIYNTASNVYYDYDQDGYTNGGLTSVCYGATIPAEYSLTSNGPDCDDNNPEYHERFPFYYDNDGDGYGSGALQDACAASAGTPPANYSTNNSDCSPFNANIWQSATLYVDIDGDGYDNGNGVICYGATVPTGYSTTTNGPDCDDNDNTKHTGYPFYADTDGDGYGTGNLVTACAANASTPPVGYAINNTDCAPANGLVWQTGTLYIDSDGDHYDNGTQSVCYGATAPTGFSLTTNGTDCNDSNPAVNSGYSFYADADGDGYGSGALISNICALNAETPPAGYSVNNNDCAPNDSGVYLGYSFYVDNDDDGYGAGIAVIICTPGGSTPPAGYSINSDDCDDNQILYADNDGDGFGSTTQVACGVANFTDCNDDQLQYDDSDGDGFGSDVTVACGVVNSEDCNDNQIQYADNDGDTFGSTVQVACGVTNFTDCNDDQLQYADIDGDGFGSDVTVACGVVNSDDCNDNQLQYADNDGDSFGSTVQVACGVTNSIDCNDDQLQYLDADGDGFGSDILVACGVVNSDDCNDGELQYADNDGDSFGSTVLVACGVTNFSDCNDDQLQYADIDGDGFGSDVTVACGVVNSDDCNDSQSQYADNDGDGFGSTQLVACGVTNSIDCNDDQLQYSDNDGDGFGSDVTVACGVVNSDDCNDNQLQYADNDADGFGSTSLVACGVANFNDCNDDQLQYADNDGDGFGSNILVACGITTNGDCNDNNQNVNPNANEVCNGIDDDCDGLTDNDDPSISPASQTTYYADTDGDGYGNPNVSIQSCSAQAGYVTNNTDCDDTNALLFPGQIWILDNDNDGYGTGATIVSCTRPTGGFFANELTATTGDCNDNNPNINPVAQRLEFSGTSNFSSSLIYPQAGTLYTDFTFEVMYFDANNQMPPATFPRVYLDYEGNGNFTGGNDRAIIMTPFDANDTNTADGKRYIATIDGLAYGTNWQTRVQVQNGACITELGPFNYPDVQVQPNLQIFANDITFSSNHPAASAPLTVNAVVHNVSDFAAENFSVRLVNQYDPNIVYGDVVVPSVAPHSSTTVTWNITTPATPAWCPMQVIIDNTNVVNESDELDNTAIRPFINGNYNLLGGIEVVNVGASPSVSYITPQPTYVSVFGRGQYFGTPTPLADPSVAGATVTLTVTETGATYSGYTNSQGYFNVSVPAPNTPGIYHITGELTDYTFIGTFTTQFERIVYIEPCPTDLYVTMQTSANTAIVSDNLPPNTILPGESVSGSFTVHNYCQPIGATVIDVSQSGGTPIADVNVPALASNATYTSNFNNIIFNTPGTYTICATADGTGLVSEINENNTSCTSITVLPNMADIYPVYGLGNTAQVCNPANLGFTLYNGGGAVTGSFNCEVIVRKDGNQLTVLNHTVPNINALSYYSFSFPYTYPSAGNYTFELRCDIPQPNGIVAETNETNNVVTYGVTAYDCIFKPDLSLLGCENFDVSPVDPQFPGMVTYTATIYNGGNTLATGPIGVRFGLSGGTVYNTTYNGTIAAGQSVVVSVNAPSVASATQTLTATVDYDNTIVEWSEDNNTISNSLCWDFEPVERNYPCGSDFWDYTQVVNQPVYLAVGVNQYNLYDASSVDVKFEVSGPGLLGTVNLGNATITNMEQTCYCPNVAALPYTFIFAEEGVYTFTMTVDPNNVYGECNEGNNVIIRQVNVTHLPDMRVLSQFINPSMLNPDPGQPITMNVTYENIGTTNLQDTMTLSILVDEIPLTSVQVTGLGTGENSTVAIPMPWSSNVVGPHIIRTIIDSGNVVNESNETNNEATRAIVVGEAANLHFDALTASNATPSIGTPLTINATIGNNGDLDVEADVVFYYMTDGLLQEQIGMLHVSVGSNSSTDIEFPWVVLDNSTTIVAKIINASVLEFTYDDNEATTILGGMSLQFQSTTACSGQDNGTLTVNPSGGQAPYSYEWENGFNGQVLTAAAGTYSVTVTDATGLSVTDNGTIADGESTTYYADSDDDGFGNPNDTTTDCEQPTGYVLNDDDCDDENPAVHTAYPFYADNDGDGFGFGQVVTICTESPTSPPTGYVLNNTDCNDAQLNYLDNDQDGFGSTTLIACGGSVNNTDCNDNQLQYVDSDGDGFGSTTLVACGVTNNSDCNDNQLQYADNDNDGFGSTTLVACGATNSSDCNDNQLQYADSDGDGFGSTTLVACGVINNSDCNDNQLQYADNDNDGFGSTTLVACGATNSSDCNNNNATVHPGALDVCGDGLDNDCNGVVDNVGQPGGCNVVVPPTVNTFNLGTSCGAMISGLAVTITAAQVSGATSYMFRVTNVATSAMFIVTRPVNSFALGNYVGVTLDTQYQIEVSVNGGANFGPPCTLFTPRPTSTIGAQCGTTLTSMTQFVYATYAASVTGYRFRVTNTTTAAVQVYDAVSGQNRFNFSQLPAAFVTYGTTYTVEVALRNTDGSYMSYGTACNISTPAFPTSEITLSQCEMTAVSNTQTISVTPVSGATGYRIQLVNLSLSYTYAVDRTTANFNLSMFPGLSQGTTYTARVAVRINGVWGPLTGKPCNLTTPGLAPEVPRTMVATTDFDVIAYPNPFAENFMLDVKTASEDVIQISVYDMLGKQVENRNVEASEINNVQFGSTYPSGVYNILISQGENTQTLRVIKR